MKRIAIGLMILGALALSGCNKGTKVHYEEERTIEQSQPVVTPDDGGTSSRTLRVGPDGKVHYEETTTTTESGTVVTGD